MRTSVALSLLLLLPSLAEAQTPVLVDREALAGKLQAFAAQVRTLQSQLGALRARRDVPVAIGELQSGSRGLGDQLAALERDIRSLPPAALPSVAARIDSPPPPPPPPPDDQTQLVVRMPPPPIYDPAIRQDRDEERHLRREEDRERGREGRRAFDDGSFRGIVDAVNNESFSTDKLRVLSDAGATRWFRVDQVAQIIALFSFPQDRTKALEIMAPRIIDRQNTFKLYGAFTFESEKADARRILEQYQP